MKYLLPLLLLVSCANYQTKPLPDYIKDLEGVRAKETFGLQKPSARAFRHAKAMLVKMSGPIKAKIELDDDKDLRIISKLEYRCSDIFDIQLYQITGNGKKIEPTTVIFTLDMKFERDLGTLEIRPDEYVSGYNGQNIPLKTGHRESIVKCIKSLKKEIVKQSKSNYL